MATVYHKHVEGLGELSAALQGIPRDLRTQVLAVAVKKAAAPVVRAAKQFAQRSRRTGALQKSITSTVRKYKNDGVAVAVIGPDKAYYGDGKRLKKGADRTGADKPANYAHLVEFGHLSRAGTGTNVATAKGTSRRKGTFEAQSFILPQPFMRPALASTAGVVRGELIKGISTGIERTRARLVKKGLHAA